MISMDINENIKCMLYKIRITRKIKFLSKLKYTDIVNWYTAL